MAEPTPRFKLSFMAIFKWVMTIFAAAAGSALVFLLLSLIGLYLMSRLPLSEFLTPVMLAIIPVLMLILVLVPVTAVGILMFQRFVAYDVTDEGLVQFAGPMKQHIDWLMINGLDIKKSFGIEQWTFTVLQQDRPFVIFASFLENPVHFNEAVQRFVPTEHVIQRQFVEK